MKIKNKKNNIEKMEKEQSKQDRLLEACKKNLGEWTCTKCSGSGQPARITANLRALGYSFEKTGKNRWVKSIHCPHCGGKTSHCKLLELEPLFESKERIPLSDEQRKRVLSIIGKKDVFTEATITSQVVEIDHMEPMSRRDKDIDVDLLTNQEIKDNFQSLTSQNNLLKAKACDKCKLTGIRPSHFGIKWYYEGNENYEGTCVGCGWYDGTTWRKKLNEHLNGNEGTKKLIKAYKKYINFLGDAYDDVFSFANIHGYKYSEENIKLGQQMRNAIKELENECAVPNNDVLMDYLY